MTTTATFKSATAEYVRSNMLTDSITLTREEYAQTIENIEDGARNDAARDLWELVKTEVCKCWNKVEELNGYNVEQGRKAAKRTTRTMLVKLDAYKVAFKALGYDLSFETDWYTNDLYQVYCPFGCIRNYS